VSHAIVRAPTTWDHDSLIPRAHGTPWPVFNQLDKNKTKIGDIHVDSVHDGGITDEGY
jgi:hypothetical protein